MEQGQSSHVVLPNSLKQTKNSASLDVLDKKTNVRFILNIVGLKDNTFRLRLSEAEPLRQRYEPPIGDVLIKEPTREE